jgi:type IV secretory pathway protease TraF
MRWVLFVGAVAIAAGVGAQAVNANSKSFLWNASSSEPKGLYMKVSDPPKVGEIVAFMAPPTAFPYADRRQHYLRIVPVLKELAAGEGACTAPFSSKEDGRGRTMDAVSIAALCLLHSQSPTAYPFANGQLRLSDRSQFRRGGARQIAAVGEPAKGT